MSWCLKCKTEVEAEDLITLCSACVGEIVARVTPEECVEIMGTLETRMRRRDEKLARNDTPG